LMAALLALFAPQRVQHNQLQRGAIEP